MKNLIIIIGIIVMVIAATFVFGQVSEGVITYESKINVHKTLPKEREDMKAIIPEFNSSRFQLFFNETQSLYKLLIDEEDDEQTNFSSGGRTVMFRRGGVNAEYFLDQDAGQMVIKQEFMGKDYLIEDSIKVSPWKFGTETKTINGYECKQAFYTDESRSDRKQEITAWYTDKLRPFLGPDRFNTLPGAILALDINNGERVILVKSIEFRPVKKNELKRPAAGTKTTSAEFRSMVEKRMQEMRSQGGMVIRN